MTASLETEIETLVGAGDSVDRDRARETFARLRSALSAGEVRAAEPAADAPAGWRVNTWVKRGILLGFRIGETIDVTVDHGRWPFFDKDTLPLKRLERFGGSAHRARWLQRARRGVCGEARHLHAADVHQHRRVC